MKTSRHGSSSWGWASIPAVAFVLLVFVVPVVLLTARSFTEPEFGLQNFERLLSQPGYVEIILRTIWISATATVIALIIGYPMAYYMVNGTRGVKVFLTIAVIAPYLTSILLRSFSWMVLLGRNGLINNALTAIGLEPVTMLFTPIAVVVSLAHYLLPLMILPIASTMRSVDTSRLKAAASLGSGPLQAFVRIYMPLTKPGVQIGVVLSFVYGVGAFVIPALLGGNDGRMLGSFIHIAIDQSADYALASAAAIVLAILVVMIVIAFQALTGMSTTELAGRAQASSSAVAKPKRRRGAASRHAVTAFFGRVAEQVDRTGITRRPRIGAVLTVILGALVLAPQLIVIPISFASTRALVFPPLGWSLQWYEEFFTEEWLEPLFVSLRIALITTVVAVVLGTLVAMGVVRGRGRGIGAATSTLMMVPLLFPLVVAAAGFYLVYLRIGLVDTELGIVLAHICIAIPFVFGTVSASLRNLNPAYENAAASLGANRFTQLRRIVAPLMLPAILTGAFFAFLTSFDESTIAVFLSGVRTKTLPRRIYEGLAFESDPTIAVIAVFTIVVTALLWGGLVLLRRALRKTKGAR